MATPEPKFLIYESTALDSSVFRVLPAWPATRLDLMSYADLHKHAPRAHFLRLWGVSMYLTLDQAKAAARRYRLGDRYAELDLGRDTRILFALTNPRTGHIDIWADADTLRGCIVGYHDNEGRMYE